MLFGATPLTVMLVIWAIVTLVFIGLVIYRSVISLVRAYSSTAKCPELCPLCKSA